jgi:ribonuclease T2
MYWAFLVRNASVVCYGHDTATGDGSVRIEVKSLNGWLRFHCEAVLKVFMERCMRAIAASLNSAALLMVIALGSARADVTITGRFTVTQTCPAFQSFRKSTNPGDVKVEQNNTYEVIAKNKPDATHYRIVVDGAEPEERWVDSSCGRVESTDQPSQVTSQSPAVTAAPSSSTNTSGARATHVLAMGWEPAFCEGHGDKIECHELTSASFSGTHLSLHGLWPQPRGAQYCNVTSDVRDIDDNHDWNDLPEPEMSPATLKRLAAVMPGVESKLERHEWIVHGTCFGGNADSYFARAAGLAEAVDVSKVSQLFADSVGKSLSAEAIRAAFDDAFGPGAGARVMISCHGRGDNRKITELTIGLAGDVKGNAGLGDLMRAAQAIPPGCPSGFVERAPF